MAHPHTITARKEKARFAQKVGITEARIDTMVEQFYHRIRKDNILAPIFNAIISDWPRHLKVMKYFWESIAIEAGRFHGAPMQKHLSIAYSGQGNAPLIGPDHFAHWLQLFQATLPEIYPDKRAIIFLSEKAEQIAESLLTGIMVKQDIYWHPDKKE